ncbi:MAG: DUF5719 family protein, partial [Nitriliruptoraceae bacterium]
MNTRAVAFAVVFSLAAAAAVTVDRFVDDPNEQVPRNILYTTQPVGGAFVCPAAGTEAGVATSIFLARTSEAQSQTSDDGGATQHTDYAVTTMQAAQRQSETRGTLGAGDYRITDVSGMPIIRWYGLPAMVSREWAFEAGDYPPGIVSGACVQAIATQWVIPGMETSGGAEARLFIANPFRSDATIAVRFMTPEGPEGPLALQNVSVAAGSTIELSVNDVLPERDDLAAIIEVAAGRVAVEGVQFMRSAIGGIDGVSLLAAAAHPSEAWTVPWVADTDEASSWLWVVNPSDRVAPVEVSVSTASGGTVVDGLEEVLVEPGMQQRIPLAGAIVNGGSAAVTVRSDGVPIVVSAGTQIATPSAERSGHIVQLGAAAASDRWIVHGGNGVDRDEYLYVVNAGSQAADVILQLRVNGAVRRLGALQEFTVPPGVTAGLDISEFVQDAEHWVASFEASSGRIVVGRSGGAATGERRLVATLGTPAWSFAADGPMLEGARSDELVRRLHTALGVVAADPFAPVPPASSPFWTVLRDEADAVAPPPSARTGGVPRITPAVPGTREADSATSAD